MFNFKKVAKFCYYKIKVAQYIASNFRGSVNNELMSVDEARKTLSSVRPQPKGKVTRDREIISDESVDLSIIVPVYNVEDTLKQCLDSCFSQKTKYSFEVIAINDGSPDNSGAILAEYKDERLKVITQENKGFSGARNTGLLARHGKYVLFLDSDDYLLPGAIEVLLNAALKKHADIVEGSYLNLRNGKLLSGFKHPEGCHQIQSYHNLYGFPWGKVYTSRIFDELEFPQDYIFEDTVVGMLWIPISKSIYTLGDNVLVYRTNPKGISATVGNTDRSIDSYWITELLVEEQSKRDLLNQENFSFFLDQLAINYFRIRQMDKKIKLAEFVLSRALLNVYLESSSVQVERLSGKKIKLVKHMLAGDYRKTIDLLAAWEGMK